MTLTRALALLLAVLGLGALTPAGASTPTTLDRISKSFVSVYLLRGPGGAVLVDAHNAGEEDWLLSELDKLGLREGELRLILLTHGHQDHAGSAAALRRATGAPIAVGAGDVAMVEQGLEELPTEVATDFRGRLLAKLLDPSIETFTPDIVIQDRLDLSEYGVPAEARVMGGHTSGSLVVFMESGQALTGDLIRGGMVRRKKPTLHFFHEDMDRAHEALQEVVDGGATSICAAHDRCMSPERVERWLARRE
ncbi:MAG: MBL fold metallo-hydrolase [Alphaproteobacteria bacterium]|nr:MBL fold metallo-hydrolase [Alphaproteobacteria bacterium]MCB9793697.1 MBL fold metallo-hydrolase [Alphaproteobacteria bacterium]